MCIKNSKVRETKLVDEENSKLIRVTINRRNKNQKIISREEFFKKNKIGKDYLNNLPEVELE
ncbi:MAG: hypothetical protein RSC93_03230 [Erysipelotrichaceae bacterium]